MGINGQGNVRSRGKGRATNEQHAGKATKRNQIVALTQQSQTRRTAASNRVIPTVYQRQGNVLNKRAS